MVARPPVPGASVVVEEQFAGVLSSERQRDRVLGLGPAFSVYMRELLRHARVRAAREAPVQDAGRGADRDLLEPLICSQQIRSFLGRVSAPDSLGWQDWKTMKASKFSDAQKAFIPLKNVVDRTTREKLVNANPFLALRGRPSSCATARFERRMLWDGPPGDRCRGASKFHSPRNDCATIVITI
jgi:hypothetical protein